MTSMKIDQISWTPTHLSIYGQNFFHAVDIGCPVSNQPSPYTPIDNQSIKRKHNPTMTIICLHAHTLGQLSFPVSTH